MAKTTKTNKKEETILNPVLDSVFKKVAQANGWVINGMVAEHGDGTKIALARNSQAIVISNNGSNTRVPIGDDTPANVIIKAVIDFKKRVKEGLKTRSDSDTIEVQPESKQQTTTKEKTTMATQTAAQKKAAKRKADAAKKAATTGTVPDPKPQQAAPAKVIGKALVNPAGKSTPIYDALKTNAETDIKIRAKLEQTWIEFGTQFDFKVGNLTKALLAEGLWPAAKDKDGDYKADPDGNQIPVGYQKVLKEEKKAGNKAIGHMVNVAGASFSRHLKKVKDEEQTANAEAARAAGTPVEETLDEKAINKILINLEKGINKLETKTIKEWLESSKGIKPALDMILEEAKDLAALEG